MAVPSRGSVVRLYSTTRSQSVRAHRTPSPQREASRQISSAARLHQACIKQAHGMSTVTAQRNEVDSRRTTLGGKHPDTLGAVSQLVGRLMLRSGH